MFIIGLFAGVLLTITATLLLAPSLLFTVSESKYDFTETTARITSATQENGWAMPHQYDLQATMQKHGFEVQPVTVFSLCKPDLAHQILSSNNDRLASAMMPCRIAVFQKADGKTYVSRMNATLLSKLMGGKVKKVMTEAGLGSEKIIEPVISQ